MRARASHASRSFFGALLAAITCASSFGQTPEVQRLPTTLAEALMRLETTDRGPTKERMAEPVELVEAFPASSPFSLEQCQSAAQYSAKVGGRALLILVNDRPIYQRYEPNWARWKPHLLGAASQCLVGLAAAAAVQDGLISFDEPVSQTISEWSGDPAKKSITIRQLLTQTSGIEPGDVAYSSTYEEAIAAPLRDTTDKTFAYGSHAFQIFGELLCRKLSKGDESPDPMGYAAFIKARIFDPLQIEAGPFLKTANSEANVAIGASLSAGDFAKIGYLLCNEGNWEGKSLIRRELIQEIFKSSDANFGYGMGIWLVPSATVEIEYSPETRALMPNMGRTRIAGMAIAAGRGRQRLYVLPKQKIVIARLGDPRIDLFRDEPFLRLLFPPTKEISPD